MAILISAVDPAGAVRAPAVRLVRWAVPMPASPTAKAWNVHWIAVRGEEAATPSAALRLATVLAAQGFTVRPLRAVELPGELASSLAATPGTAVTAREDWSSFTLARLHHATYRLTKPSRDPAALARLLGWFAGPPALSTCTSVLLTATDVTAAMRIAVPGDGSRRAIRAASRKALGKLKPYTAAMHGQQAAGVRATIPL